MLHSNSPASHHTLRADLTTLWHAHFQHVVGIACTITQICPVLARLCAARRILPSCTWCCKIGWQITTQIPWVTRARWLQRPCCTTSSRLIQLLCPAATSWRSQTNPVVLKNSARGTTVRFENKTSDAGIRSQRT